MTNNICGCCQIEAEVGDCTECTECATHDSLYGQDCPCPATKPEHVLTRAREAIAIAWKRKYAIDCLLWYLNDGSPPPADVLKRIHAANVPAPFEPDRDAPWAYVPAPKIGAEA